MAPIEGDPQQIPDFLRFTVLDPTLVYSFGVMQRHAGSLWYGMLNVQAGARH